MEPFFYWREEWDRLLIRPEDLRAIEHRLSAGIGEALPGQKPWKLLTWHDRFQSAGVGSVEFQVVELRARYRTMISLGMVIARTPEDVTLKAVMDAPKRDPMRPNRTTYETDAPPKAVELNLETGPPWGKRPGAQLQVWSRERISGQNVLSFVTPHIEQTVRKAPQPEPVGIAAALLGAAAPDVLLAFDLISPALALLLVFILGCGFYFSTIRAMGWLFPPLEFLPDEHTLSRWQKTWRVFKGVSAAVVGLVGIAGFVLALGQ
ncbi:MAG TPA: hypothetical protein VNP96_06385 [Solirubrobacterales bacterium]|nr:hypothetical protein [Solirubrobacterales bacterium]